MGVAGGSGPHQDHCTDLWLLGRERRLLHGQWPAGLPAFPPGGGRGSWVDEKDIQGSPHAVPRAPLLSAQGHARGFLAKMTGRLSGVGATLVSLVRETSSSASRAAADLGFLRLFNSDFCSEGCLLLSGDQRLSAGAGSGP